jgi:hypothetical protein
MNKKSPTYRPEEKTVLAESSEAAEEHAKAYAWAKKWALLRAKSAIETESLAKLTKKYGALAANPPALFIKHGYRWTENHGGLWMVPTENYKELMEEFLSPSEYALALEEYGNVDPETVGGSVLAKDYPLGSVSPSSEKIEPFSLDHKTAKDACENNLQQYVYKTQDEQQLEDIARKDKDLGLILLNAWVWVFGVAAACGIGYVVFKALLKWSI